MIPSFVFLQSLIVIVCLFAQVYSEIRVRANGEVADWSRKACLECQANATAGEKNLQFVWTKDEKKIEKDERTISIEHKEFSSTLCFKFIDERSLGEYLCKVSGENVQEEQSHSATLSSMPFFKKTHRSQTAVEGQTLALTCTSWGLPRPEVWWVFDDEHRVKEDARVHVSKHHDGAHVVVSNLEIEQVTKQDHGNYTCIADNNLGGRPQSHGTMVRIKGKLAPLWPFIGLLCELILIAIIVLCVEIRDMQRNKSGEADDAKKTPGKKAKVAPSD